MDTGADLLWRVRHNLRLPREAVLADGSCLTTVYPSDKDRRHRRAGVQVRVVEYRLEGVAGAEPFYRLVTTILDPAKAPAAELAALLGLTRFGGHSEAFARGSANAKN